MRASHVALLSLAASTVAPVFAAPLSHFNARSKGAALGARDSRDSCTEGNVPKQPTTRDSFDDVEQEAHAHGSSDKAFGVVERNVPEDFTTEPVSIPEDKFLSAMLSDRDLNPGQDIQARSFLSNVIKAREGGFLRRDVTHDQLLAARDGADLINSIMGSRDSNTDTGFVKVLNALASSRRDVPSDELAARDNWEDLVQMLNTRESGFKRDMQARGLFTSFLSWALHKLMSLPIRLRDLTADELAGRDTVDDILDTYMSNHATREPSPQQETQARSIPVDPTETVARDGGATSTFIDALLRSRDSSRSFTPDDVLTLASLASRALDELD